MSTAITDVSGLDDDARLVCRQCAWQGAKSELADDGPNFPHVCPLCGFQGFNLPGQQDDKPDLAAAALAIANKIPEQLYDLQNVVHLAAFAVEARRVLDHVQAACIYDVDLHARVFGTLYASAQWGEMRDVAGFVLESAGDDLARVAERADKLLSHLQRLQRNAGQGGTR